LIRDWTHKEIKSKAPPFDVAEGRLSPKEREKWGTRQERIPQLK